MDRVIGTAHLRGTRMRVIQVAIADDDPTFREALAEVLGADPRFHVVGAMPSGQDVVDLVAVRGADVVLLDVRMPGGGPEGARMLAVTSGPDSAPPTVVALSAQAGVGMVTEMLRAGATGYLVKGRVGTDLPDLVARCAAGEVVLAVGTAAEALRHLTHRH